MVRLRNTLLLSINNNREKSKVQQYLNVLNYKIKKKGKC